MSKLTKQLIESAIPQDKAFEIKDDEIRGFGVRIYPVSARYPKGRRVFFIRTYPRGSNAECRTTIGDYGLKTLDEARKEARAALVLADEGKSPTLKRRGWISDGPRTVAEACARYLAEHVAVHDAQGTYRSLKSKIDCWVVPKIGALPLKEVGKDQIMRMHALIGEHSQKTADAVVLQISGLFSWCQGRGFMDPNLPNPCKLDKRGFVGLKLFNANGKRQRILRRADINRLFAVLGEQEQRFLRGKVTVHPHTILLIKLLYYTGARLSELYRLEELEWFEKGYYLGWRSIDLERGAIFLDRTKEKKPKTIYLCTQALALLRSHKSRQEELGKLNRPVIDIADPATPWRKTIRKLAKLEKTPASEAFTFHHFRHNFLSYGGHAGVPDRLLKRLVGHSVGDTTDKYTHYVDPFLKRAAQKVADALDTLDVDAELLEENMPAF